MSQVVIPLCPSTESGSRVADHPIRPGMILKWQWLFLGVATSELICLNETLEYACGKGKTCTTYNYSCSTLNATFEQGWNRSKRARVDVVVVWELGPCSHTRTRPLAGLRMASCDGLGMPRCWRQGRAMQQVHLASLGRGSFSCQIGRASTRALAEGDRP